MLKLKLFIFMIIVDVVIKVWIAQLAFMYVENFKVFKLVFIHFHTQILLLAIII